jgi:DNA modification methylase
MIVNADARFIPLADESVNCVITSPPYYGLRDYGTARWEGGDPNCEHTVGSGDNDNLKLYVTRPERDGAKRQYCQKCGAIRIDAQIGLEQTPDEYIANLVAVFRECKRILRDDGTLWVNIGSSFVSGIIESQEYILRDDLTAEELEYVYSELAEHFKAQSKAVSDLWETNAPTEQEVSGLLRPGKSAA